MWEGAGAVNKHLELTLSKEKDGLLCEVVPTAPGLCNDVLNVQHPPVIEDPRHSLTGTQHTAGILCRGEHNSSTLTQYKVLTAW